MNTKIELGRIAGIPIVIDMLFVLLLILLSWPFFTAGTMQAASIGVVYIAGLLISVLLHELGHAFVGRLFGARVALIELTGLGGIAQFERSLPRGWLIRSLIFLAGPAANLALWLGLDWLRATDLGGSTPALALTIYLLAQANFWLLVFNLLPAFPLDGGRTLEAMFDAIIGHVWSVKVVAVLGLGVSLLIAVFALQVQGFFLLIAAFVIAAQNWEALQSVR
jgi:Zn-dependent protease